MKFKFVPLAAAVALIGGSASADSFVDAVVKNFQDLGYQYVEVERGQTQLKAEGVRGNESLEVIYDLTTGQIIKQEKGRAESEYVGRTGVEIGASNEDFVGKDDNESDDENDGRDDRSHDDDNEDDDHSGSDDHDSGDDDHSGSGSDSGSDHEDHGDDHSGSDSNDSHDDDSGSDDSHDDKDDD